MLRRICAYFAVGAITIAPISIAQSQEVAKAPSLEETMAFVVEKTNLYKDNRFTLRGFERYLVESGARFRHYMHEETGNTEKPSLSSDDYKDEAYKNSVTLESDCFLILNKQNYSIHYDYHYYDAFGEYREREIPVPVIKGATTSTRTTIPLHMTNVSGPTKINETTYDLSFTTLSNAAVFKQVTHDPQSQWYDIKDGKVTGVYDFTDIVSSVSVSFADWDIAYRVQTALVYASTLCSQKYTKPEPF